MPPRLRLPRWRLRSLRQQSAMDALLLERERLAMIVEDQASFMAQRHWVSTLHLQRLCRPMTWRELYEQRHSDLERAWAAMRVALRAHGRGEPELAERVLQAEVGSSEEEAEEEDMEVDVEVAENSEVSPP